MTVTTAIEGLRGIPAFFERFGNDQTIIVVITLTIILILFSVQRFGTELVEKAFGPIMFLWFTFLGIIGLMNFSQDWTVIRALNPYYALQLLVSPENKLGLFILGNIFLATTGAEALYSDLGHVGKMNIRISWPYIKICLILNYLGQAAWLLTVKENPEMQALAEINPFFQMIPRGILVFGVVFATIAAVIASQALISGSYTLVSEAIKLKLLPRLKIIYPGSNIGQMYIPAVNLILWLACSAIVLAFRTSTHMEAAYLISLFFAAIEVVFFFSSAAKFFHGGYVAVGMAVFLLCIMIIWERGNEIKEATAEQVSLEKYVPQLKALKEDTSVPMYQTNVVFLTSDRVDGEINRNIIYSILDKQPKRANVYWFVNVQVTDEPFTQEYSVDMLGTDFIVQVQLYLGFHISQEVNVYLRQIVHDLMKTGRLPKQPQRYSLTPGREVGDFQFVLIQEELSNVSELKKWDRQIMQAKLAIKNLTTSPESWFGLEYSEVKYESVPLIIGPQRKTHLVERKNRS